MTWTKSLGALMLVALPVAAQAVKAPTDRIGAYDDAVIGVMKAKLDLPARADRFEPIVRSYYDMQAIAGLVVGPVWASASASDKAAAITALTRHSAVSLAKNFKSYDGEKFTVDPKPVDRGATQVVKVTINSDILFYRMHQAGGQWKIVDVISGGVSQLSLQRADLASTVQSGGVAALVKRLGQLDAVR